MNILNDTAGLTRNFETPEEFYRDFLPTQPVETQKFFFEHPEFTPSTVPEYFQRLHENGFDNAYLLALAVGLPLPNEKQVGDFLRQHTHDLPATLMRDFGKVVVDRFLDNTSWRVETAQILLNETYKDELPAVVQWAKRFLPFLDVPHEIKKTSQATGVTVVTEMAAGLVDFALNEYGSQGTIGAFCDLGFAIQDGRPLMPTVLNLIPEAGVAHDLRLAVNMAKGVGGTFVGPLTSSAGVGLQIYSEAKEGSFPEHNPSEYLYPISLAGTRWVILVGGAVLGGMGLRAATVAPAETVSTGMTASAISSESGVSTALARIPKTTTALARLSDVAELPATAALRSAIEYLEALPINVPIKPPLVVLSREIPRRVSGGFVFLDDGTMLEPVWGTLYRRVEQTLGPRPVMDRVLTPTDLAVEELLNGVDDTYPLAVAEPVIRVPLGAGRMLRLGAGVMSETAMTVDGLLVSLATALEVDLPPGLSATSTVDEAIAKLIEARLAVQRLKGEAEHLSEEAQRVALSLLGRVFEDSGDEPEVVDVMAGSGNRSRSGSPRTAEDVFRTMTRRHPDWYGTPISIEDDGRTLHSLPLISTEGSPWSKFVEQAARLGYRVVYTPELVDPPLTANHDRFRISAECDHQNRLIHVSSASIRIGHPTSAEIHEMVHVVRDSVVGHVFSGVFPNPFSAPSLARYTSASELAAYPIDVAHSLMSLPSVSEDDVSQRARVIKAWRSLTRGEDPDLEFGTRIQLSEALDQALGNKAALDRYQHFDELIGVYADRPQPRIVIANHEPRILITIDLKRDGHVLVKAAEDSGGFGLIYSMEDLPSDMQAALRGIAPPGGEEFEFSEMVARFIHSRFESDIADLKERVGRQITLEREAFGILVSVRGEIDKGDVENSLRVIRQAIPELQRRAANLIQTALLSGETLSPDWMVVSDDSSTTLPYVPGLSNGPGAAANPDPEEYRRLAAPADVAAYVAARCANDPRVKAVYNELNDAGLVRMRDDGSVYVRPLRTWSEGLAALSAVQQAATKSLSMETTEGLETDTRVQLGDVMQDIGRLIDWGDPVGLGKGMNETLRCLWDWTRHLPKGVNENTAIEKQIRGARDEAIGHGASGRGVTLVGRLSILLSLLNSSDVVSTIRETRLVWLASLPQLMSYDAVGRLLIEARMAKEVLGYAPIQDGLDRELPAFFGVDMATIRGWSRTEYEQHFRERYNALWLAIGPRLSPLHVETVYQGQQVASLFDKAFERSDPTEALRELAAHREMTTRWAQVNGGQYLAEGRILDALFLATFISEYADHFYNIDYHVNGWSADRVDQELWNVMMGEVRELDRVLAELNENACLPEALRDEDSLFFLGENVTKVLEGSRGGNFVTSEDQEIIDRVLARWERFLSGESR